MKHLIIPDQHNLPGASTDRAVWLGKLILDEKPDVVINLGDCWDMPSLCSYDKGTKDFHGSSSIVGYNRVVPPREFQIIERNGTFKFVLYLKKTVYPVLVVANNEYSSRKSFFGLFDCRPESFIKLHS